MTKTKSKLIVAVLAIVTAFCLAIGIFSAIPAKADGQAVFGIRGAQVRIATDAQSDDSGIRFVAEINKTAYDQIVSEANGKTVFFGIELSVGGKSPLSFCYTASNLSGLNGFEKLEFASDAAVDTFTASITYNEEILAKQLGLSEKFNTAYDASLSDEENVEAFIESGLLDEYLEVAYKTEITAKAYYQVETTDAEKVYATSEEVARSIYGVAAEAFLDKEDDTLFEDGNFALVGKYFASATTFEEAVTVNEYGTITGYEFAETDKVYCKTKPVTVTGGKIDKALVSTLQDGDAFTLSVIKEDGSLITLNATFDMLAEVISTEAIYDATAQKLYYETADGVQIVDATNAFLVEDGTEFELVKNQYLFNKKDAVAFGNPPVETGIADWAVSHHIDDLTGLNADLTVKTTDGTALKEVYIPYRVSTADYTGVAMNIKNANGDILYSLSDVVLATAVIDDGLELKNTFNKPDGTKEYTVGTLGNITKGVYMLVDDIDAKEEGKEFVFFNSSKNLFDGLLDGRGHSIFNLDVSGTESAPGNGLFSAIAAGSCIQNIGFVDVVANYGSVFQGNIKEANAWYLKTYGMHWGYTYEGISGDDTGRGYPDYRAQLGIPESDTTTLLTDYLTNDGYRTNKGLNKGAVYSNLFVRVAPQTKGLMGVISRQLLNTGNQMRGYNVVIEYTPTGETLAFYENNYTESGYGVLFGGAYVYEQSGGNTTLTWYEPTGIDSQSDWNGLALNYVTSQQRINGYSSKIYVVSPVGLVSSTKGAILGTNETAGEGQVKFFTHKANAGYGRLARFDTYEDIGKLNFALAELLSTLYASTAGAEKFWTWENNYLAWKNLPAETPVA